MAFQASRRRRVRPTAHRSRLDRPDAASRLPRFVAQGGDWGNALTEQMALEAPSELIGIHTNMPATLPDEGLRALQFGRTGSAWHVARGVGCSTTTTAATA